jgi:orotate phosphoribosyltransferase
MLTHNVVGFFPQEITLSSGRKSSWYVNWRTVSSNTFLMDQLSDFVVAFLRGQKTAFECIFGVPEGATKLAVISQLKWAKAQPDFATRAYPLAMGRGKVKTHGDPKDAQFVGIPNGRIVVLEDVTTTGESLIKTVAQLQSLGLEVVMAVSLTHRNERRDNGQTVAEALHAMNVKHCAMSEALTFLPIVIAQHHPSPEIMHSITQEFALYGEREITL